MAGTLSKILHVEDEQDIQEIVKLALETIGGFSVETCSSGHEALEKVSLFQPDLFLLDVMMPGMDGPETLSALREEAGFADTPVIFMTAKVMEDEVIRFKEIGALDVISKPFDPMSLGEKIKAIWDASHG
ncbi:MAG: response regulator [Rhodospirillales bacterium]|nr:response regulator [Rhodospirillales bacterium]MBT4626817.1 response regulator [Rhodospirillales bacterium]MBT5351067.1 response regulator [Rhodospirillales bacterium]MBT5521200.1 response regulator [Rhodospirillales bacterium]MBT6110300.1 response regulator [Rhodospirillales bacterium]